MSGIGLRDFFASNVKEAGDLNKGIWTATQKVLASQNPEVGARIPIENASLREIWESTIGMYGISIQDYVFNPRNAEFDQSRTYEDRRVREDIGSGAFYTLTNTLITGSVMPSYDYSLGDISALYTEEDADREDNVLSAMQSFHPLKVVPQGTAFPQSDWGDKYVNIKVYKIGEQIHLTKELVADDQTNQVLSRARTIGELMGLTQHKLTIETFCDSTRNTIDGDTQSFRYKGTAATFYSTDHSAIDGQTNANTVATSPLGTTGLQNAVNALWAMKDDRGNRIMGASPRVIVVPTNLTVTAWNIINSSLIPENANNAINAFGPRGDKLHRVEKVITSPYLNTTDISGVSGYTANDWYAGEPARGLVWLWSWRPQIKTLGENSEISFTNDIIAAFRVDFRGGPGWRDYRFVVRCSAA